MKNSIKAVKRLVSEMESYVYCDNYDKVNELANELFNATKIIKEKCDKAGNSQNNDFRSIVNEYPGFSLISTLPFLYKPILVKNYYDGDYLERFSRRRTEDLKGAKVLDLHNKFWMSNNVESGNVFGSIPLELISKESANALLSSGWKKTDVSIFEIEEGINFKELDRFCSKTFEYYIVATEMRNNTKLVLNYDILDADDL